MSHLSPATAAPAGSVASGAGPDDLVYGQVAEEVNACLRAGRDPDVAALAARYPHLAGQVRELVGALLVLRQLNPEELVPASAGRPLTPDAAVLGCLGDFQIIREVGRGGMGVVFEAEQISLGRRVALKVLPFASTLDPRQLQRFHNEAHAAAQLHHPHIVPVYATGCERGVHFYAMQFIDGQTLAQLINQLRRREGRKAGDATGPPASPVPMADAPTGSDPLPPFVVPYREGVGLAAAPPADTAPGAQLGTEHAARGPGYFRGVARLGIEAAEALEYAHQLGVVHRDVKPANLLLDGRGNLWVTDFGLAHVRRDVPLTMSGEVVGTLRYMSPEQAKARPGVADHRADVYGLGATLYELLTLEPAFAGKDVHELLRQIALDEPRAPRQCHPAIPAGLETIVLKAMAKEPDERYATAGELAADLRCFLEDKPIRARSPTLGQRLTKWARRHRPLVVAGVVVLLTALGASVLSSVLIFQAYRAETVARTEASRNLKSAMRVLDQVYLEVAEERLPRDGPADQEADRRLLAKARGFYEEFARQHSTNYEVQREVGRAYLRIGEIDWLLGRLEQARQAYWRAQDITAALAAEAPDDPEVHYDQGHAYYGLVGVARARGDRQALQTNCRRALAVFAELRERYPQEPKFHSGVAAVYQRLGEQAWRDWNHTRAIEHYRKVVALRKQAVALDRAGPDKATLRLRRNLGTSLEDLGSALRDGGGDPEEAQRCFRQASRVYQDLLADAPRNAMVRRDLGSVFNNWGQLLARRRQQKQGEQLWLRAVACYAKAIALHPNVVVFRSDLADVENNLAEMLEGQGRTEQARQYFRKAIGHAKEVLRVSPDQHLCRYEVARARRHLGNLWAAQGKAADAEQAYRAALRSYEAVLDRLPTHTWSADGLVDGSFALGHLLVRSGRAAEARQVCRRVRDRVPDNPAVQNSLAWQLATCPDPELRDPQEAIRRAKKNVAARPAEADYWNTLGAAYYRAGNWQDALDALGHSMRLTKGGDSGNWFFAAMAHWRRGDKQHARTWYQKAVQDMEQRPSLHADDAELRRFRAEAAALLGEPFPEDLKIRSRKN
jgi:serine/threonine protein kinase/Flp pilus assembly protein TadD